MADEVKQGEQQGCAAKQAGCGVMKTVVKVLVGIAFLGVGVYLVGRWWGAVWLLIRGCAGPVLILVGLITIAIARD